MPHYHECIIIILRSEGACVTIMCAAVMVPIGHQKRSDKQQRQGRKIGVVCISRMYLQNYTQCMQVMYLSAHSNHDTGEKEDAFIPLPTSSKENMAMKISIGNKLKTHCFVPSSNLICSYMRVQ